MIVRGFGIGMSMMPAMTAAYAVLRPDQVNNATPQLNVLQRVGGSIGTAILAVVAPERHQRAGRPTPAGVAGAFGDTYWWVIGDHRRRAAADDRADRRRAPRASRRPPRLPADAALEAA